MSKKNAEYDFKWCPGCGDFGVRRALEFSMVDRLEETGLPMENNVVIAGIGYAMWRVEAIKLDHLGVIAVVIFTFFFVTVSSRLVGMVGSSSNPISGMTIATLLATALVYKFFVLDRADDPSQVDLTALKTTCLVICAIVAMVLRRNSCVSRLA